MIEIELKFARLCVFHRTFLYKIFEPKRKACDVIHLECLHIICNSEENAGKTAGG